MIRENDIEPMFRFGVVEDVNDNLKLGRIRVRVAGVHTDNTNLLPTSDLPWAIALVAGEGIISGIGKNNRIVPGTWVIVSFMDTAKQKPIVWGSVAGIPSSNTNISPIDSSLIEDLSSNIPPVAPPATVSSPNGSSELPYIGSLTNTQVTALIAEIKKDLPTATSDSIEASIKSYYMSLANAGILSPDVIPEKAAGILMAAHSFGIASTIDYIQNGIDKQDVNGNFISNSYRRGYNTISGVDTNEAPTLQNINQPAIDKTAIQLYQDARKYDAGNNAVTPLQGFTDPTNTYPRKDRLNESDLNRLARGSNTSKTIVGIKEANRITNIPVANSSSTWSQSPIPYGTTYPNNQVMETPSGHIMEFDDTTGHERINIHHRTGTFLEIDSDGNKVERTKGIRTIIVEKDELVYVKGSGHVNLDGDLSVRVGGNSNIEVLGNANMHVHGDLNQQIDGAWNVTANILNISAKSTAKIAAQTSMEIGSSGSFMIGGAGNIVNSLGNLGAPIALTTVSVPDNKSVTAYSPSITIPSPITRQEAVDMILEDSPDITAPMYANAPAPTQTASNTTTPLNVLAVDGICGFTDISAGMQLTTNYRLSDLLGSHPFPYTDGQHGLMPAELACNLKQLAINVIEPLRAKYASIGFKINSCFREAGSNISKSSGISQHELGQAVDISFSSVRGQPNDRQQFYNLAGEIMNAVPFDQLLLEYRSGGSVWIHISYKTGSLRKQVLTMYNDKVYGTGLHLLT